MGIIHISESEATRDFASVMDHVRAGSEVVIDNNAAAVAILRPVDPNLRRLSESLRLAKEHRSTVKLDGGFGRDLADVIHSYGEPVRSEWD